MSAGQRSRQLALGAVVLDGDTGELRRLGPFTVHSAALDFWRAPTDNDTRNGLRTAIPDAESWRQAGLDRLQHSIITVQRGDGELRTRLRIAPAGADFGLLAALTWAADPQQRADCLLSVQVAPDGAWPCPLPKVGLRLVLDAVVQEVSWFGRGPGEAYRDTQLATRTSTSPSATGRRNCSPPPGTDRISSLTAALTSTWTLPITASAAARADPDAAQPHPRPAHRGLHPEVLRVTQGSRARRAAGPDRPRGCRRHGAAPEGISAGAAFAVTRSLAEMLRQRGIEHVYSAVYPTVGVISVTPDLTVWTDGVTLRWSRDGTPDHCPAADLQAAAERLATLADLAGSGPARNTETK